MFIFGCHRSGTSYLASLLAAIIDYECMADMPATLDNPYGYYESEFLRKTNDHLLDKSGYAWDRPPITPIHWTQGKYLVIANSIKDKFENYSLTDNWIDKDPRLAIVIKFYQHIILKRTASAVIIRSPEEVALSLFNRDGFPLEKGLLIWYLYNRHCSVNIDCNIDQLFSYEDLLESSDSEIRKLIIFAKKYCLEKLEMNLFNEYIIAKHKHKTHKRARRSKVINYNDFNSNYLSASLLSICSDAYNELKKTSFNCSAYANAFSLIPPIIINSYDYIFSLGEPSHEYIRLRS